MAFIPWRNKRKDGELAPLGELRQEMDRLFDSFMRDPLGSLSETFGGQRGWSPNIDMAENDQEITVRAEVAGIGPQDLDITVAGNRLTLAGEKKDFLERKEQGCHLSESRYGTFRRHVDLPCDVDGDQVSADYANGVVTIRLKKSQAAAGKRVEIKTS